MFTTLPRPTLLKECVEIKSSSLKMKKKKKNIQNDFKWFFFFVTWSNVIMTQFETLHVTILFYFFAMSSIWNVRMDGTV